MGWGIFIAALLGLFGWAGRTAHKNDRKWPQFRNVAGGGLFVVMCAAFCVAGGLALAIGFEKQIREMFAAFAIISGSALVLLLLVLFADWSRD